MVISSGKELYAKLRKTSPQLLPDILPSIPTEILHEYCAIVEGKRNSTENEKTLYGVVWRECVSREGNPREAPNENGCPNSRAPSVEREVALHRENTILPPKESKSIRRDKIQDPLYVALIKELARSEIYDKKHGHLTQSISSFLKQEVDGRRYEDIVLSSCGYLNTSREKEARVTLSKYSHSLRKRISGGKKTYKTARGETRTVTTKGITFKAIYSETFPDNADPCNILAQTGNFSIDLSDGNQREESITSDCENDPPSCNDQHFPCGSRVHLLSPMHRSDEGQYIVYKVAEGISMCVGGQLCNCHEHVRVKITDIKANPWHADNRRALSVPVIGLFIDISNLCVDNFERCPAALIEKKCRTAKEIMDEDTADVSAYIKKRAKSRGYQRRREEADWLQCLEKYASSWLEKYPGREIPRPSQGNEDLEVDSLANWISKLVTTANGKAEGKDDAKQRYAYVLLTTAVKDILQRQEKEWWTDTPRQRGRPRKSGDLLTLCKKRRLKRRTSVTEVVATPPLTTSSKGRVRKPKWDSTYQYM